MAMKDYFPVIVWGTFGIVGGGSVLMASAPYVAKWGFIAIAMLLILCGMIVAGLKWDLEA